MASKYPYPSTLNVGNFVSIKLTPDNYRLWMTQMLGLVESQDMMDFITGETPAPPQTTTDSDGKKITNLDFASWRRSDRLLRGWITGTLTEETLTLVVGLQTSMDVWNALTDSFAQGSTEREFHLEQKLQSIRKGTASISNYISSFKTICDDLAAMGKPVDDRKKVFWLLNGLGKEYKSFVTTMLKPPIPSYKEILPLLQNHETWINTHETETNHESSGLKVFGVKDRHKIKISVGLNNRLIDVEVNIMHGRAINNWIFRVTTRYHLIG
ncbi:hypothetical protein AQUCO_00600275v1 [Aquilegia coerulea]|uniref:Retrotransposon Copia-like N-terminal domain-containing protein n=1 Tax=Aquilegia coerulea TaxID=218851 RepID=A0A2G5ENS8_AQUCA|nr:hypothetical protein AQUCO_00600275v1 [Aquilegia coerulea]